ncbi:hypothetical protein L3Q82_017647, partial [Scortum barcoo]
DGVCPLTFLPNGEMGCTPSKSAVIYTQDKVSRDLDTCSTFVPSLKSCVSTPERPRLCAESGGRQTFLSGELTMRLAVLRVVRTMEPVPCRDVHGRSVSQSSCPESWSSAGGSFSADQPSAKPRGPAPELPGDPESCGTG